MSKEFDINEFKFIKTIGCSSHGQVYAAVNKKTGEKVAIKKILRYKNASLKESLEVYNLNLPCMVKIYGYSKSAYKRHFFLVMEYLEYDAENLNDRCIRKKGKVHIINSTVRSKIIFRLAAIFKKLHEQNVIFRNLKLSKIGLVALPKMNISNQKFYTIYLQKLSKNQKMVLLVPHCTWHQNYFLTILTHIVSQLMFFIRGNVVFNV